jgi:hypothetical protein
MPEEYIESDVKEFISRLPNLSTEPPTVHLTMLCVRSKKVKELLGYKLSDLVVERDIIRATMHSGGVELSVGEMEANWRDRYFDKIHNLAILQHYGQYDVKTEKKSIPRIPKEAMGILATLSPRNVYQAITLVMKDNIQHMLSRDESSNISLTMENSRFFGALHKSKAKGTHFVTVDVDTTDLNICKDVFDFTTSYPRFMITETSGGYHFVLDLTMAADATDWHGENGGQQQLGLKYPPVMVDDKPKAVIEFQNDAQEPIPGTLYCRKGGIHHFVRFAE